MRLVAFDTVLYMLLALGLNVVVGWGGLLDLGFVAFYGIGAYTYAFLDSDQFGIHLPTIVTVPVVVVVGALIGLMLGLPSRRLSGDYLAIVTLVLPPALPDAGHERRQRQRSQHHRWAVRDSQRRPVQLFRSRAGRRSTRAFSPCRISMSRSRSSPSCSWRSGSSTSPEPVARGARFVRIRSQPRPWACPSTGSSSSSFASGAAVAALTGTLFAALTGSVFPLAFYFVLLITVYTMVILGGSGSQAGVVLGAIIIGPLLEALRDPNKSRAIFFIVAGRGLPSRRGSRALAVAAVGLVVFGFVVHAIAGEMHSSWVAGEHAGGLAGFLANWVVAPAHLARWVAPSRTWARSLPCSSSRSSRARWRLIALVPTLYLAAFVWENVMLAKPEPARYIVLGLILIGADDPAAERPARRAPRGDRLDAACSSCKGSRSPSAA